MPVTREPKYIFTDGVMQLNPKYVADEKAGETKTTVANPQQSLAIVSNMEDISKASEAKKEVGAGPVQLSTATVSSLQIMQDSDYSNKFEAKEEISSGDLVDGLTKYFARYEVPIGLINKILALLEYKINFIIDDSGSMYAPTDASINDATEQVKKLYDPSGARAKSSNNNMSRWEEAQDRLHIFADMLSYIPTDTITFRFLNSKETLTLQHSGKTPDQFREDMHNQINALFRRVRPSGGTPLLNALQASLNPDERVMQYILTDGEPDRLEQVKSLILNRKNPKENPITFLSCTNSDQDAEWMKVIEEVAPYVAELDDFVAERTEVQHDQGPSFPYSKGFWLLCQLVAAINPDDLDALDEDRPFSKKTMDNFMGRKLTAEEFKKYFDNHPLGKKKDYNDLFTEFSREDITAKQVLEKHRPDLLQKPTNNFSSLSLSR